MLEKPLDFNPGECHKLNKIGSFVQIMLLHLIKRTAEKLTTRSWDISIHNAVAEIIRSNKRRKAGGYYLALDELREAIDENYESALRLASLEAFGGVYNPSQLDEMIDGESVKQEALILLQKAQL